MAIYTVKAGDTLSKISRAFSTTVEDILAANRIPNPDLIRTGQRIVVPGLPEARRDEDPDSEHYKHIYVVRKGDTMVKIAQAHGVSLADLVRHNRQISNPSLIRSGDLVNVPTGLRTARAVISKVIPPASSGDDPPWLAFAVKERESDIEEIGGRKHNPRILEYHATTSLAANKDETPWCSSFVNWCFTQAGVRGTNRANARSWLSWGVPLVQPRPGAVAVFWRGPKDDDRTGHVGFYLGDDGSTIRLLGGNQGDRVSIRNQSMAKFLGYRYPKGE